MTLLWMELQNIRLLAKYILGKRNVIVKQLSQSRQIVLTEWFLLPKLFDKICWILKRLMVDLFVLHLNHKLLVYVRCGVMYNVSYVQGLAHPLVIIHHPYISAASLSEGRGV